MRHKLANEKAVKKTLNYLNTLYDKCNGNKEFIGITNSQLQTFFNINKSTYAVCKELGIVIEHEDYTEWSKESPRREMVLSIMDKLLNRRKINSDVLISPDWQALNGTLRDISEKITIGITQNKNRLDGFKMPQTSNTLFSEQEQRQKDRVYIAGQIANGIYSGRVCGDLQPHTIAIISNTVLNATDHLLNKLYSK